MNRILYIVTDISKDSGVSSVIINYYRHFTDIKIDFLVMKKAENSYEEELISSGSNIFYLNNPFSIFHLSNIKHEIDSFFEQCNYKIIELHAPTFSFLFLKSAMKYNIPIRIVHCHSTIHSTNKLKNFLSILLNVNMKRYANIYFSCSKKASEYWYGNKIYSNSNHYIIINGVDIDKYKHDEKIRQAIRKKYDLNNYKVVGFVGRISKDKNLPFLIDVMKDVIKQDDKYKLIIVGDGKLLQKLKINLSEVEQNVLFLGMRNDVNELLNSFDLLLLPSKREGLPMAVIEAQLNNVPCFLSNTITDESNIGGVKFLPLKKNIWTDEILNFEKQDLNIDREKFNIVNCSIELSKIYNKLFKRIK